MIMSFKKTSVGGKTKLLAVTVHFTMAMDLEPLATKELQERISLHLQKAIRDFDYKAKGTE